jgi:hypothetical protein
MQARMSRLRLANLAQGDWLSRASYVAYQGGIDHLMRAGQRRGPARSPSTGSRRATTG